MSKFARAAHTSQTLSLAAMEEASRLGLRQADIEHLFLALVINDQAAGLALRSLDIDLDGARRAVEQQHDESLAVLGIDAPFPEAGRIVFHETGGYEWSERALDLLNRSAGKGKAGDSSAVLRELLLEPSGTISAILQRVGTTSSAVIERLARFDAAAPEPTQIVSHHPERTTASIETFVPASVNAVWELLSDPARVPTWEMSVGSIEHSGGESQIGEVLQGRAPTQRPDGKPLKVKPKFRRRAIALVASNPPASIAWEFGYPDASASTPVLTELGLVSTTGGTTVHITKSWARRKGWRRVVAWPLRPIAKFVVWVTLFQTGSAISRVFR